MNFLKRTAILSALFALTACGGSNSGNPGGGGSGGGGNSNTITRVADITLTDVSSTRGGAAFFYSYSAAIPTPTLSPAASGCTVYNQSPVQPVPPNPIIPGGAIPTPIDAGTPVLIKSGGSTYATLNRSINGSDIRYNGFGSGAIPDGATVDIPGAVGGFPAFSGLAFPSSADFTFSATPSTGAVTKDSTFSWGSGQANSLMMFSSLSADASNNIKGFSCVVADTGSFSLPAQTKSQLDAAGYTSGSVQFVARYTTRIEVQGNTALVLKVLRMKVSGF